MLVKAYIVEYGYKVQSIGIPSLDNNFVTYISILGLPTLRIFRMDEYLKIYLNKKGLVYFNDDESMSEFPVEAVIYNKPAFNYTSILSNRKYIYLPKYKCSSTFNIKEPTEEMVKKYIEGYKCL
nr:MAG TPA: hypothetical protein [Caudoviricetes sp.]